MKPLQEPVGFALCGASGIAIAHGHTLQRSPHTRLVRVYSRDAVRAQRLGTTMGCDWTTSYDNLLEDPRVTAVDITTEPERHAALALPALARGKHVLVEKPIEVDLEAAGRIVAAAAAAGRSVSVVSPRRFDAALRSLRDRIRDGEIGSVRAATAVMLMRRDRSYYEQPPGWRQRWGHVLLNQGVHWLDALIWLFGFPEVVTAVTYAHREFAGSFDTAMVCSRHPDGILSVLSASTACEETRTDSLTVHGETASLEYQAGRRRGTLDRLSAVAGRVLHPGSRHFRDPLGAQINDLVRSIRTGEPPGVTAQDGYNALRFVRLCEAAALTVSPV